MNKKQKALAAQEQQRQTQLQQRQQVPKLPTHDPLPHIDSFGGENGRTGAYANQQNQQYTNNQSAPHAIPMQPQYYSMSPSQQSHVGAHVASSSPGSKNGDYVDPYARTESMTHRGRYSYASSAVSTTGINSPRRVRRRKDPTPFK